MLFRSLVIMHFALLSRGTYNNQYMILDLNKIKLNKSIDDGALSVVEQIPGLVEWADQTHKLRLGKFSALFIDSFSYGDYAGNSTKTRTWFERYMSNLKCIFYFVVQSCSEKSLMF